jgi:hypothetical protein
VNLSNVGASDGERSVLILPALKSICCGCFEKKNQQVHGPLAVEVSVKATGATGVDHAKMVEHWLPRWAKTMFIVEVSAPSSLPLPALFFPSFLRSCLPSFLPAGLPSFISFLCFLHFLPLSTAFESFLLCPSFLCFLPSSSFHHQNHLQCEEDEKTLNAAFKSKGLPLLTERKSIHGGWSEVGG